MPDPHGTAAATPTLVLGAGELGMAVLRGLADRVGGRPDVPLSVLLRPSTLASTDPAKQRDLAALRRLGVTPVAGDLTEDSVAALAARFRDFHTVIGCTGFVGGRGTQLKLARAAVDAGVGRCFPLAVRRRLRRDRPGQRPGPVRRAARRPRPAPVAAPPGMGHRLDRDVHQLPVRARLRRRGLGRRHRPRPGDWDTAVTVTAAADIGSLTAAIALAEPRVADRVVYTAGDTITYARLADVVSAVLGRPVRRERWTVPMLRETLARDPDDPLKKYRLVFVEGRGVARDVARTFNAQHRIAVTDVERWARENLKRPRAEVQRPARNACP